MIDGTTFKMSVPFFIGDQMLNTKIGKLGLVSVVVLGLAVSKVAANETETQVSSDENSIRYSVSKVEGKQTVTTTKDQEEKKNQLLLIRRL